MQRGGMHGQDSTAGRARELAWDPGSSQDDKKVLRSSHSLPASLGSAQGSASQPERTHLMSTSEVCHDFPRSASVASRLDCEEGSAKAV